MRKLIKLIVLAAALTVEAANAYENDCYNNDDPNPCGCEEEVGDPIHPGSGDAYRVVTDLETYGFAPVKFSRTYNSRTTNFNDPYWDFGNRQTWQHNWNYEMRQLQSKTFDQFDIKVRYPSGQDVNFKAPDATSNQRIPPAQYGDRLYKWSGSTVGYTLVTQNGEEYDFIRYNSPAFHLIEMRDGKGLNWTFTYGADEKLKRISNPFGRWIEIERTDVSGISCITRIFANDGRQVTYDYSSWSPTNSIVLTQVNYPENQRAIYSWVTADPSSTTARPLLETAIDPTYRHAGAKTKFIYNYNAIYPGSFGLVTGTVLEQRDLVTNALIVSLPSGGGSYPEVREGNGTEITRKFQNGHLVESRDGEGRITTYTYSAGGFGFRESMTAPNGAVTHYTRDYAGRVLTQTNGLSGTRSFTYNTAGFVLTETDELNRTTTTTRNSANQPTRIDYPDSSFETWTYNSFGQPLTHRLRSGGTETFAYVVGNLSSKTDALSNTTTYTYYPSGLRSSTTDARLFTTSYTYNWRGELITTTHPDNTTISYGYDEMGNRTSVTDELGHTTTSTYDQYNRLTSVTDALNRTTTYEYGLAPGCTTCGYVDVVSRITKPGGRIIEYTYDRSRLRTSQTIGAGTGYAAATTFSYDNGKNVTTVTDPRGNDWHYNYDLLHRKISATDPLGNQMQWSYDAVGNKLTETRPDGGVTYHSYDARNRLTQTTDPLNQVTQMTYDNGDNLLSIRDARNNIYTHSYDLLNRKLSLKYPNDSIESYAYDATGNMATYTTRAGQVETFAYDNRNRETGSSWSDSTPAVTKTYDAAGRVTQIVSNVSTLDYTYDDANQLTSETQKIASGGRQKTVRYLYDGDGNRTVLTYPDGNTVRNSYTTLNKVDYVTWILPPSRYDATFAFYRYDNNGNLRGRNLWANGTDMDYAYDSANRLTSIVHRNSPNFYSLANIFASFDYGYNSTGTRKYVKREDGKGDTYGYDPIDEVTSTNYAVSNPDTIPANPSRVVGYNYDPVGNRTSVIDEPLGNPMLGTTTDYQTNDLNEYTAVGSDMPTYDANGNLTAQGGWTYTYDALNRMTSASTMGTNTTVGSISASTPGAITLTFAYDARNRCVSRTVNGVVTRFYYDGWNLIEERNAADVQTARYIHGAGVDKIISKITPTEAVYYHYDALGNTIALTDALGNVVEKYNYDVYGAPMIMNAQGAPIATSAYGNRFLFTGREYIKELGLYDYRKRMYSPTLGRFLQTDPARFDSGDFNLYRYVRNNVVSFTDPNGDQIEHLLAPLLEALLGAHSTGGKPEPAGEWELHNELEFQGEDGCHKECYYQRFSEGTRDNAHMDYRTLYICCGEDCPDSPE